MRISDWSSDVCSSDLARTKTWISRHYGEEGGSQILISLLIPFASYLVAEHLHCSGILAAVAAGLTMGFVERTGEIEATTRIRRNTVWDTIQFARSEEHTSNSSH